MVVVYDQLQDKSATSKTMTPNDDDEVDDSISDSDKQSKSSTPKQAGNWSRNIKSSN